MNRHRYHINWNIEFDWSLEDITPEMILSEEPGHVTAAKWALSTMRDPESIATVFQVTDNLTGKVYTIDIEDLGTPLILRIDRE